jgi:sialidase-1
MCRRILFLLILFSIFKGHVQAQPASKADRWKGFERTYMTIDHHAAYYVKPAKPLPGNPWVWRAAFPDWHPAMDSLLLSRGFYIAYINVDDQYGSPAALQEWDRFYNYLTDSLQFSTKPALEAVSRGAL